MSTAVQVHRRKLPRTGDAATTLEAAKQQAATAANAARERARRATEAAKSRPRPSVAGKPVAKRSVAAATAQAATPQGNFSPDPVIARLNERAANPVAAPSWKSFKRYATEHPDLTELHRMGLRSAMHERQGLRLGVAAVVGAFVILLIALLAYWWLLPATADADAPYTTADAAQLTSTSAEHWEAGVIPALYQSDVNWGALPYGQDTMANTGAAPTALAMAYIAATGDDAYTPADFATWATEHDLTAAGTDTIAAFLEGAAADFDIALTPVELTDRALRQAIVSNTPVIVVTHPGTFSPVTSAVVLDDIDKDSRIMLHDPTSESRSAKSWAFKDIISAGAVAYAVTPA